MKRIDFFSLKFAKASVIFIFSLLILDFALRRPPVITKIFEQASMKRMERIADKLPQRKDFKEYLDLLSNKQVFYFPEKKKETIRETKKEKIDPLADLTFNGIIVLDKKYVAIYNNKNQNQYLIAEGEDYQGINVKKIKDASVIIEVNGEEKEISF